MNHKREKTKLTVQTPVFPVFVEENVISEKSLYVEILYIRIYLYDIYEYAKYIT